MTTATDANTEFNYLLNAVELAAGMAQPAAHGYGEKRAALIAHVRKLEALAERTDAAPAGEPLREQRAVVGYMVHSSGPIEAAALYPLSQHANALDAAHRWGASITSLVCAPGCPEVAAPAGEPDVGRDRNGKS